MKIMHFTFALLMAFTLVISSEVEAKGKHGSEKTRSRVLKEYFKKQN